MKTRLFILALLAAAFLWIIPRAHAQGVGSAIVVSSCGTLATTYVAGLPFPMTIDTSGKLCNSAAGGGGGAATIANGADVAEGSTTDSPCTTPTTAAACTMVSLSKAMVNAIVNNLLPTGTAGSPATTVLTVQGITSMTPILATLQAGSALAGKVGIDQTTPGTTNGVAVAQIGSTTVLAGNGTSGAGALRVNLASDNSAVSGLGAVATGAAPPANAIYLGANASGATGGHIAGLISCDNHVFKHITSATDTLAVQGVASQTIYICSWRSRAAGTATWFLENTASANANCASTLTQINGVATEAANTGETWGSNFWSGLKNTSGNGLCINSTGTGGEDIDIWYTQF